MWISFNNDGLKVAWRESFESLKGSNLLILMLVSLRALKNLYKSLMHAWFLPLALLIGLLLNIRLLVCAFYITVLLRAARPSIALKSKDYWLQLNLVDWVLFFGRAGIVDLVYNLLIMKQTTSFAYFIISQLYKMLTSFFFLANFSLLPGSDTLGVISYILSPFVIIWVLFMLDAQKTVWQYSAAFGRAMTMFVYNYPFFLISYVVLRFSLSVGYLAARPFVHMNDYIPLVGWLLLFLVIIPFYACFIMSFYTKKVHEQFGLYYRP